MINREPIIDPKTNIPRNPIITNDDNIPKTPVDELGGGEPVLVSLSATENGEYTPESGIDGFNPVLVNVSPKLTGLSVTENGTYLPEAPFEGFSGVVVNVPPSLPSEYLESEFDLLHSNSTVGFIDSVKNIKLATNKYNQFGDGYILGRSAGVMLGYTNQGDIKRFVVKMGTFDRSLETQDQYQTLFKLVSNNNHFTVRWDNTNRWWLISDASGANIKILEEDLPKYSFDGANVEIVFGAKYINDELYRGIKQGDVVTTDFSSHFFVYVNGVLKIEAPNEQMTGDTLNTIGVLNIGGRQSTWVGASFEECKIYNVLNCYDKYKEV